MKKSWYILSMLSLHIANDVSEKEPSTYLIFILVLARSMVTLQSATELENCLVQTDINNAFIAALS